MGVTIRSEHLSGSLGYCSFNALRLRIAGLLSPEWEAHIRRQYEQSFPSEKWLDEYIAETSRMSESLPDDMYPVLDFLYASDCDGEMDATTCALLLGLCERVEDSEGKVVYGYAAHPDAFTFGDFCMILRDGIDTGRGFRWH